MTLEEGMNQFPLPPENIETSSGLSLLNPSTQLGEMVMEKEMNQFQLTLEDIRTSSGVTLRDPPPYSPLSSTSTESSNLSSEVGSLDLNNSNGQTTSPTTVAAFTNYAELSLLATSEHFGIPLAAQKRQIEDMYEELKVKAECPFKLPRDLNYAIQVIDVLSQQPLISDKKLEFYVKKMAGWGYSEKNTKKILSIMWGKCNGKQRIFQVPNPKDDSKVYMTKEKMRMVIRKIFEVTGPDPSVVAARQNYAFYSPKVVNQQKSPSKTARTIPPASSQHVSGTVESPINHSPSIQCFQDVPEGNTGREVLPIQMSNPNGLKEVNNVALDPPNVAIGKFIRSQRSGSEKIPEQEKMTPLSNTITEELQKFLNTSLPSSNPEVLNDAITKNALFATLLKKKPEGIQTAVWHPPGPPMITNRAGVLSSVPGHIRMANMKVPAPVRVPQPTVIQKTPNLETEIKKADVPDAKKEMNALPSPLSSENHQLATPSTTIRVPISVATTSPGTTPTQASPMIATSSEDSGTKALKPVITSSSKPALFEYSVTDMPLDFEPAPSNLPVTPSCASSVPRMFPITASPPILSTPDYKIFSHAIETVKNRTLSRGVPPSESRRKRVRRTKAEYMQQKKLAQEARAHIESYPIKMVYQRCPLTGNTIQVPSRPPGSLGTSSTQGQHIPAPNQTPSMQLPGLYQNPSSLGDLPPGAVPTTGSAGLLTQSSTSGNQQLPCPYNLNVDYNQQMQLLLASKAPAVQPPFFDPSLVQQLFDTVAQNAKLATTLPPVQPGYQMMNQGIAQSVQLGLTTTGSLPPKSAPVPVKAAEPDLNDPFGILSGPGDPQTKETYNQLANAFASYIVQNRASLPIPVAPTTLPPPQSIAPIETSAPPAGYVLGKDTTALLLAPGSLGSFSTLKNGIVPLTKPGSTDQTPYAGVMEGLLHSPMNQIPAQIARSPLTPQSVPGAFSFMNHGQGQLSQAIATPSAPEQANNNQLHLSEYQILAANLYNQQLLQSMITTSSAAPPTANPVYHRAPIPISAHQLYSNATHPDQAAPGPSQ